MISENKLKHTIGVARRCKELAAERGLSDVEQNACFVMGLLHDIGYENDVEITEHPRESYLMAMSAVLHSHEILPAIKNHGRKYNDLTIYDEILNEADLTIDHEGKKTTIQDRLRNIQEHHGIKSEHYKHANAQANALGRMK